MKREISIKILMMFFFYTGFVAPLLLTWDTGDASPNSRVDVIAELGNKGTINWTTKLVRVRGNGYAPENVEELGRRKILAQRAAQLDAYRNLLEVVKGVQVTSYIDIESMMRDSDTIRTQTKGMVKGMRLVEVVYSNDGACRVTVEVNFDKQGNFLLAALSNGEVKVTDKYPKFDWVAQRKELERIKSGYASLAKDFKNKTEELEHSQQEAAHLKEQLKNGETFHATGNAKSNSEPSKPAAAALEPIFNPQTANTDYTGLLVDARGTGIKPALAPAILNEKQEKMYGIGVMPSRISVGAIVSYLYGDIERAKKYKKIGNNPLIVKCIKAVNRSDIMLDSEDAEKLKFIDELLEQMKVAVLI